MKTSPLKKYTPQPYSPPSQNTTNDAILNQILQKVSSLQKKISTINQNQNGQPTYYVKRNPLSLEILRMLIPQDLEIPRFGKYGGKGDPYNHVFAYTTLCSDFLLEDKLSLSFPYVLERYYFRMVFLISEQLNSFIQWTFWGLYKPFPSAHDS